MFLSAGNELILFKLPKECYNQNRISILTNDSIKSMGRFRIQLLLADNTWTTRYKIPKNDRYSDSSTDWTLVSLYFTV